MDSNPATPTRSCLNLFPQISVGSNKRTPGVYPGGPPRRLMLILSSSCPLLGSCKYADAPYGGTSAGQTPAKTLDAHNRPDDTALVALKRSFRLNFRAMVQYPPETQARQLDDRTFDLSDCWS